MKVSRDIYLASFFLIFFLLFQEPIFSLEREDFILKSFSTEKETYFRNEPIALKISYRNQYVKPIKLDSRDLMNAVIFVDKNDNERYFKFFRENAQKSYQHKRVMLVLHHLAKIPPGGIYNDLLWICIGYKGIRPIPDFAGNRAGDFKLKIPGIKDTHINIKVKVPEKEIDKKALEFFTLPVGLLFSNASLLFDTQKKYVDKAWKNSAKIISNFPESVYAPYSAVALINYQLQTNKLGDTYLKEYDSIVEKLPKSYIKRVLLEKLVQLCGKLGLEKKSNYFMKNIPNSSAFFVPKVEVKNKEWIKEQAKKEADIKKLREFITEDQTKQQKLIPVKTSKNIKFEGLNLMNVPEQKLFCDYFKTYAKCNWGPWGQLMNKNYWGELGNIESTISQKKEFFIKYNWNSMKIIIQKATAIKKYVSHNVTFQGDITECRYQFDRTFQQRQSGHIFKPRSHTMQMIILNQDGVCSILSNTVVKTEENPLLDSTLELANELESAELKEIQIQTQKGLEYLIKLIKQKINFSKGATLLDWKYNKYIINSTDNTSLIVGEFVVSTHDEQYHLYEIGMTFNYDKHNAKLILKDLVLKKKLTSNNTKKKRCQYKQMIDL